MKLLTVYILLLISVFSIGQTIDSIQNAPNIKDKSEVYNKLSDDYKSTSDLKQVKFFADSALWYSNKYKNQQGEGDAYLNLGDYYYYKSNFDSSIYFYKRSALIYEELNNNSSIASAYSNIGAIYFSISDYDASIKNFIKAAKYQKLSKDTNELAIIQNNIATVYYLIDKYAKAIEFYNKSLELKKKSKDYLSIATGLNNIANVYGTIGDFEQSISLYFDAIKYCDISKNQSLKSTTLNNIAGVYKDWKEYDKAIDLYLQSLEIKKAIKDLDGEANILNNIGLVFKLKKDFTKAQSYFVEAEVLFNKTGNKKRLAIVYGNLGTIKEYNNELDKAFELYKKSASINQNIGSPKGMALDYLNLCRVSLSMNNIQKAENYIKKSIEITKASELTSIWVNIYKLLSLLHEKKGNYKNSLRYYKRYTEANDSSFTTNKLKQLNEINAKYETEKKNQRIELLDSKNKQQTTELKAKKQERNLWLGISILSIIIGSISVYFFLNKKKLSEKLSQKNKIIEQTLGEKDVLLREIHHRVKNNLQIISSLLNMQSRYLDDEKSKEVVSESQNRIKSMSLIHQKLYQEENLTGIETKSYFTELIESLCLSYGVDQEKVNIEIENIVLDVDTAIPLGLILNEMISNAFKYGVNKETGQFSFIFRQNSGEELLIKMQDNGPGIPEDFDIKKSKSYGMKLIKSLSKKLRAEVNFENKSGLLITMKIHKFKIS